MESASGGVIGGGMTGKTGDSRGFMTYVVGLIRRFPRLTYCEMDD